MLSLYSILNADAGASGSSPIIGVAILAAIAVLLIAFVIGWKKGIRRISWNGITWLVAFAIYFVVNGMDLGLPAPVVAIAAAVAALLIHNLMVVVFRPKMKWKSMKNFKRFGEKARDYEYEMDFSEYDDFLDARYVMTSKGMKPGFLGKIFGGIFCIFNTVMYIAAIGIVAVYVLSTTTIMAPEGLMGRDPAMLALLTHAMDFVIIGIVICMACSGFRKGLIGAIRSFFVMFGSLLAIGLAFGLPFVMPDMFAGLTETLQPMFEGFGDLSAMLANVALGMILLIPMLIVIALVNYFIGKLARGIRSVGGFRFVDGLFGSLVYLALAVVACALACFALDLLLGVMGANFTNVHILMSEVPNTIVVWTADFIRTTFLTAA